RLLYLVSTDDSDIASVRMTADGTTTNVTVISAADAQPSQILDFMQDDLATSRCYEVYVETTGDDTHINSVASTNARGTGADMNTSGPTTGATMPAGGRYYGWSDGATRRVTIATRTSTGTLAVGSTTYEQNISGSTGLTTIESTAADVG